MSVCFGSWAGYAGCITSARHAARVLGGSWVALGEGEPPAEAIDCDLLILSSWAHGYDAVLERRSGPTVGRWHSSLLQTELSREGWKLARLLDLLDADRLAAIAVNDTAVAHALGRKLVHLPDVFDPSELAGMRPARLSGINVSLPGEPHGRKNLLVQSAAFERARRGAPWTLHLFGQTLRRPGYARWLELAGVPYVEHGFLPRSEYLELVAAMDAALVASLSESYGYAAAEHVAFGVPVVGSAAIRSLDAGPLTVADASSVSEVEVALERALQNQELVEGQRASLHRIAAANETIARQTLEQLQRSGAGVEPTQRGAATPHRF